MGDGHDHLAAGPGAEGALTRALGLLVAFVVLEVAAGVLAGSLALLADAAHMFADVGALGVSIWAIRLARRPHTSVWSYGLKRAEILAAAANGVLLVAAAALILNEAAHRLVHPPAVAGGAVVVVALVGIVVNLGATRIIAAAGRGSLNVEGAYQHILTDLYGFVGTAVAGGVVLATGWRRADPLASLVILVLVLRAAWGLLRASGHVLLEGTPNDVDLDEVRRHLHSLPEVLSVHDLHAWTLTSELPALTAHVVVNDECLRDGSAGLLLDRLQQCVADHFDVEHSTFQIEAATHAAHEPGTHD